MLYKIFGVIVIVLAVVMVILTRIPGFAWVGSIPIILMGIFFVYVIITMKRDEKKNKEYRKQNVSEVIIQDSFFGEVICDFDKKMNRLTIKSINVPFGKYNPKIWIDNYEEDKKEFYFRKLEYIYHLQQEMVETMLEGVLENYIQSEDVTRERLEETFSIEKIIIEKCDAEYCQYMFAEDYIFEGDGFECEPGDWILVVESVVDKNKIFRNYYGIIPTAFLKCETNEICYALSE